MANPAPTLLSTFEVLFTQQFPRIPPTANFEGGNDYVIKGYFLTIANPNPKQYVFNVGFHCDPPGAGDRGLGATSPFLDSSTAGTQPSFGGAVTTDGSLQVTVPARGTILVGLLPTIFGSTIKSDIDVRGWVDLTLPPIRGKEPFIFVSQSGANVPVIVTAEQRLTFLPPAAGEAVTNDPVLASPINFDAVETQAAFALPLASGAALIEVPPQPGRIIIFHPEQEATAQDAAFVDAMMKQSPIEMARLFGKPLDKS